MEFDDKRYFDEGYKIVFKPECSACMDSGSVLARKIGTQMQPFAFRCNCLRGRNSTRAFPDWAHANKGLYEIVRPQE